MSKLHAASLIPAFIASLLATALLPASEPARQDEAETLVGNPDGTAHYHPYPHEYAARPDLPSPYTAPGGRQYITVFTKAETYAIVDVTLEDDEVEVTGYKHPYRKGLQLRVDAEDFPALAATGLHSPGELASCQSITGKPLARIDEDARPGAFSFEGFIAADEDIISVLTGDNAFVGAMGLTHPDMARPLYYVWNYLLTEFNLDRAGRHWAPCKFICYNGHEVHFEAEGSRGFQESLFNDEIKGACRLWLSREPSKEELHFLEGKYAHLDEESFAGMVAALSTFHTGEMVPYYIMRYGFYEGHTGYRADPIAIAFIFGLRSLEEIEAAFDGRLDEALSRHFDPRSAATHPAR